MALSSYANLVTDVREIIRETSASTWSDAEIARKISSAEQWLCQFLSSLRNSGRFIYEEEITLAASTEAYDTAGLTKGDGVAGDFTGIRWITMQALNSEWVPCQPIPEGDENLYRLPANYSPSPWSVPSYRLRDENIDFLPTSTAARTLRISYGWTPVRKGVGGTAETPKRYDDILTLRAAYDLLGLLGQSEGTFETKYATRLAEIEDFEFDRVNKGTSRTVKNVSGRGLFPY